MSERVAIVAGAEDELGRATAVSTTALIYLTRVLDLELRPLGIG